MSLVARPMTSPELALDRTPGQFSKPYLAIARYNTIYTAQLATVPSSTDNVYQIAYNTPSGTLADVKAGMTLYIGSSAGAHDIGRVRLRAAPDASYFYIAATSTIDWSAASPIYLTVVDDFALRMKPALWSASMKMDYGTAYSNQHSSFDPVPVMGLHAVAWMDTSYTGAELVTNGTFPTNTNGWTAGGGALLSVVSAAMRVSRNGAGVVDHGYQDVAVVSGKIYKFSVNIKAYSHQYEVWVNGSLLFNYSQGTGVKTYFVTATSGTMRIAFRALNNTNATMDVDDVSLILQGAVVSFDDSDSWVIGSTITGHSWTAPGASGTSGLTTATPTFSYNAPGFYRVYDTVTAANGKTFMGVRHVWVFSAAAMPATRFQIKENPRGDVSSGGWSFSVTLYDEAALADVRDGALVMLCAEDWYGATKQSISPIAGRENIKTWGWIAGKTIQWSKDGGSVEFTVQGPAAWLKQMPIYLYDMKFKTSAAKWSEMPSLNVQRALFHLFHWRTTITAIMDVKITDDARMSPNFQAPKGTVWGQIEEIAKKILARPGVDRYGRLFVEIDPQMTPVASRTWATVMTVTGADRLNEIALREVEEMKPASMLPTSGWQTNSSGKAVTLYSLAMGHFPLDFGSMEPPIDKLLVTDQTQGNEMAGLILGWKNNKWPDVPISMPHNNCFIDCWPNQFIATTLDSADSPREEEFSGNLIPRAVELAWDPASNSFGLNASCEAETFPTLAIDGDAPVGSTGGDVSTPPAPPPPPPPPPPGDTGNDNHPTTLVIVTGGHGVMWTDTFDEDSPEWFFMNSGLATGDSTRIKQIVKGPGGILMLGVGDTSPEAFDRIYYAPALGAAWVDLGQPEEGNWIAIGIHPHTGALAAVGGSGSARGFYSGGPSGLTRVSPEDIDGESQYSDLSYGGGGWFLSYAVNTLGEEPSFATFSSDGSSITYDDTDLHTRLSLYVNPGGYHWHRRGGSGPICYLWNQSTVYTGTARIMRTDDNGGSFTELSGCEPNTVSGLAVSPSGQFLIGGKNSVIPQRSSDYGATWGNVAANGGMTVGYRVFENCGDDDRWLAGGGNILLTLDWGDNWVNKNGNLLTLAPLVSITHIKYLAG